MRKLKVGNRIALVHEDRRVGGTVRRVGCNNPDCPSCEEHWKEEAVPVLDLEAKQPRSCSTCGDKRILSFPEGSGMRIMACPACTAKRLDVTPNTKGTPS